MEYPDTWSNSILGVSGRVFFLHEIDVEAESPILWPPDTKSWLIGKDPDAGKDWGQEEKVRTEDEMVGWHHQLDGHGFGWTPGVGDKQEAWHAAVHGVAKSRTQLNDWTELNWTFKSVDWVKQIASLVWVGIIQAVKGLNKTKRLILLQVRQNSSCLPPLDLKHWLLSLPAFGLELNPQLSWFSGLPETWEHYNAFTIHLSHPGTIISVIYSQDLWLLLSKSYLEGLF